MSTKSAQLLRYMEDNPDTEFTIQEIQDFMGCSYNHARSFARRPDVVEVFPGSRPIVVKFNKERAQRYREKNANKVSVNRQIRDAANSLRPIPDSPNVSATADHSQCIKRNVPSPTDARRLIQTILDGNLPDDNLAHVGPVALIESAVAGTQTINTLKNNAKVLWELADYLENNPNEFGV